MESSRKQFRFEVLIERFFSNFFRIMLTNILFFVPLTALGSAYYFVSSNVDNMLVRLVVLVVCVVLLFPFYAGLVMVCRDIARGDKDVKVIKTFLKGMKQNAIFRQSFWTLFTKRYETRWRTIFHTVTNLWVHYVCPAP